ncbi:uncharacterized protein LOC141910345 [Tubulanus polymorphus]|uniref:uncharacterized protein LOC141910345 n=1 Tax=Tubulanus polymorphus TaxID=672921 RepID=UPI003DA221AD
MSSGDLFEEAIFSETRDEEVDGDDIQGDGDGSFLLAANQSFDVVTTSPLDNEPANRLLRNNNEADVDVCLLPNEAEDHAHNNNHNNSYIDDKSLVGVANYVNSNNEHLAHNVFNIDSIVGDNEIIINSDTQSGSFCASRSNDEIEISMPLSVVVTREKSVCENDGKNEIADVVELDSCRKKDCEIEFATEIDCEVPTRNDCEIAAMDDCDLATKNVCKIAIMNDCEYDSKITTKNDCKIATEDDCKIQNDSKKIKNDSKIANNTKPDCETEITSENDGEITAKIDYKNTIENVTSLWGSNETSLNTSSSEMFTCVSNCESDTLDSLTPLASSSDESLTREAQNACDFRIAFDTTLDQTRADRGKIETIQNSKIVEDENLDTEVIPRDEKIVVDGVKNTNECPGEVLEVGFEIDGRVENEVVEDEMKDELKIDENLKNEQHVQNFKKEYTLSRENLCLEAQRQSLLKIAFDTTLDLTAKSINTMMDVCSESGSEIKPAEKFSTISELYDVNLIDKPVDEPSAESPAEVMNSELSTSSETNEVDLENDHKSTEQGMEDFDGEYFPVQMRINKISAFKIAFNTTLEQTEVGSHTLETSSERMTEMADGQKIVEHSKADENVEDILFVSDSLENESKSERFEVDFEMNAEVNSNNVEENILIDIGSEIESVTNELEENHYPAFAIEEKNVLGEEGNVEENGNEMSDKIVKCLGRPDHVECRINERIEESGRSENITDEVEDYLSAVDNDDAALDDTLNDFQSPLSSASQTTQAMSSSEFKQSRALNREVEFDNDDDDDDESCQKMSDHLSQGKFDDHSSYNSSNSTDLVTAWDEYSSIKKESPNKVLSNPFNDDLQIDRKYIFDSNGATTERDDFIVQENDVICYVELVKNIDERLSSIESRNSKQSMSIHDADENIQESEAEDCDQPDNGCTCKTGQEDIQKLAMDNPEQENVEVYHVIAPDVKNADTFDADRDVNTANVIATLEPVDFTLSGEDFSEPEVIGGDKNIFLFTPDRNENNIPLEVVNSEQNLEDPITHKTVEVDNDVSPVNNNVIGKFPSNGDLEPVDNFELNSEETQEHVAYDVEKKSPQENEAVEFQYNSKETQEHEAVKFDNGILPVALDSDVDELQETHIVVDTDYSKEEVIDSKSNECEYIAYDEHCSSDTEIGNDGESVKPVGTASVRTLCKDIVDDICSSLNLKEPVHDNLNVNLSNSALSLQKKPVAFFIGENTCIMKPGCKDAEILPSQPMSPKVREKFGNLMKIDRKEAWSVWKLHQEQRSPSRFNVIADNSPSCLSGRSLKYGSQVSDIEMGNPLSLHDEITENDNLNDEASAPPDCKTVRDQAISEHDVNKSPKGIIIYSNEKDQTCFEEVDIDANLEMPSVNLMEKHNIDDESMKTLPSNFQTIGDQITAKQSMDECPESKFSRSIGRCFLKNDDQTDPRKMLMEPSESAFVQTGPNVPLVTAVDKIESGVQEAKANEGDGEIISSGEEDVKIYDIRNDLAEIGGKIKAELMTDIPKDQLETETEFYFLKAAEINADYIANFGSSSNTHEFQSSEISDAFAKKTSVDSHQSVDNPVDFKSNRRSSGGLNVSTGADTSLEWDGLVESTRSDLVVDSTFSDVDSAIFSPCRNLDTSDRKSSEAKSVCFDSEKESNLIQRSVGIKNIPDLFIDSVDSAESQKDDGDNDNAQTDDYEIVLPEIIAEECKVDFIESIKKLAFDCDNVDSDFDDNRKSCYEHKSLADCSIDTDDTSPEINDKVDDDDDVLIADSQDDVASDFSSLRHSTPSVSLANKRSGRKLLPDPWDVMEPVLETVGITTDAASFDLERDLATNLECSVIIGDSTKEVVADSMPKMQNFEPVEGFSSMRSARLETEDRIFVDPKENMENSRVSEIISYNVGVKHPCSTDLENGDAAIMTIKDDRNTVEDMKSEMLEIDKIEINLGDRKYTGKIVDDKLDNIAISECARNRGRACENLLVKKSDSNQELPVFQNVDQMWNITPANAVYYSANSDRIVFVDISGTETSTSAHCLEAEGHSINELDEKKLAKSYDDEVEVVNSRASKSRGRSRVELGEDMDEKICDEYEKLINSEVFVENDAERTDRSENGKIPETSSMKRSNDVSIMRSVDVAEVSDEKKFDSSLDAKYLDNVVLSPCPVDVVARLMNSCHQVDDSWEEIPSTSDANVLELRQDEDTELQLDQFATQFIAVIIEQAQKDETSERERYLFEKVPRLDTTGVIEGGKEAWNVQCDRRNGLQTRNVRLLVEGNEERIEILEEVRNDEEVESIMKNEEQLRQKFTDKRQCANDDADYVDSKSWNDLEVGDNEKEPSEHTAVFIIDSSSSDDDDADVDETDDDSDDYAVVDDDKFYDNNEVGYVFTTGNGGMKDTYCSTENSGTIPSGCNYRLESIIEENEDDTNNEEKLGKNLSGRLDMIEEEGNDLMCQISSSGLEETVTCPKSSSQEENVTSQGENVIRPKCSSLIPQLDSNFTCSGGRGNENSGHSTATCEKFGKVDDNKDLNSDWDEGAEHASPGVDDAVNAIGTDELQDDEQHQEQQSAGEDADTSDEFITLQSSLERAADADGDDNESDDKTENDDEFLTDDDDSSSLTAADEEAGKEEANKDAESVDVTAIDNDDGGNLDGRFDDSERHMREDGAMVNEESEDDWSTDSEGETRL